MVFRNKNDSEIDRLLDNAKGNRIELPKKLHETPLYVYALYMVIGVLLTLAIWEATALIYNTWFSVSMTFPTPIEVFERLADYLDGETVYRATIFEHTAASISRWIRGFALAFIIGLAIGLLLASNEKIYQIGIVPISIIQMIPGLAWLPVAIILFGFGDTSAIFIVGIVVISPVALSVSSGLRRVPKVNMRLAKMSGLSRTDILMEVLLPFALLDIINGLRIGLGSSWRMIIAAEMVVGVSVGLGFCINNMTSALNYVSAFVCIVIICLIGLFIDRVLLEWVERRARKKMGYSIGGSE